MLHQEAKSRFGIKAMPLLMIFIAMSFYLYEFILRVAPGAIFAELMRDFNIHAQQLGMLSSLIFSCYALIQIPVGVWTDKFGPRRLLTIGILLCALSTLLFAYTESYFFVCVARVLIGAGAAFAFICTMKIATDWFEPKYFSFIVGMAVAMGSLGAIFGVTEIASLVEHMSWRTLFYRLGWIGVALAVMAWVFLKDRNTARQPVTSEGVACTAAQSLKGSLKKVVSSRQNWYIGLYGLLVTAPLDAMGGSWGTPFLVYSHGMDKVTASEICSMMYFGMMFGGPVIGLLSDWLKNRTFVMGGAALLATISVGYLFFAPTLSQQMAYVLFFTFGFFGNFVLSFVVASEANSPVYAATVVGFINCFANMGSWFVTFFIGVVIEYAWGMGPQALLPDGIPLYTHEQFSLGLLIIPLCYLLATILSFFFVRETYISRKAPH